MGGGKASFVACLTRLTIDHASVRDEAVGGGGRWYYWYNATTHLPMLGDRE